MNQRKAGIVLSYMCEAVRIISNLIYTPIMLRLLGQSEYGLYQMVYSVVSYLSLLSFGFNAAYIRYYSRYKVVSDTKGIASLNGMFITIFTCIAAVATLAGSVLVINIEAVLGNNLTVAEMETARVLMILMVINLALTFPSSVFDCYVTSQERFVFQKVVMIIQQIMNPVVTLPLLLLGYGSVALICVTTAFTVAKLLINIYFCIVKLHMQISFRGFKFSLLQEMGVFTFFIFLNQIIDQFNWNVDKFLLGRFVGTTAVAVYGVASTINGMYMQLSSTVSSVFVPKVNALVAQGNNDKVTDLYIRVGRLIFMISLYIFVGFVFCGKEFVCLWAGEEYREAYYVVLLLISPLVIILPHSLSIEIRRAKNLHRKVAVMMLMTALCNALISIPLSKYWGARGAAFGTCLCLLFNRVVVDIYYLKVVKLDVKKLYRNMFQILKSYIVPITVGLLGIFLQKFWACAIWAVFYTVVYAYYTYTAAMLAEEQKMITNIVKGIRKRL